MPPRRTRADLSEATCGGNRWEGALTFNESGTQRRITHKHANASNSFHLTARLCFKPAYCDRKGQSRARLRPTARLPLGRLISSLNGSSLCCHVVLCGHVGCLKLAVFTHSDLILTSLLTLFSPRGFRWTISDWHMDGMVSLFVHLKSGSSFSEHTVLADDLPRPLRHATMAWFWWRSAPLSD